MGNFVMINGVVTWTSGRSCSVVDSIECEAPPGYTRIGKLIECWGCADDVCMECSSLLMYPWKGQMRRVRMCFRCQDERKVGRATPTPLR